MRTYNTIKEMNEVAMKQWREFAVNGGYDDAMEWSEDELADWASKEIATADELGIYGMDNEQGVWVPWFTMEMESWARNETDGIEAEIEILN